MNHLSPRCLLNLNWDQHHQPRELIGSSDEIEIYRNISSSAANSSIMNRPNLGELVNAEEWSASGRATTNSKKRKAMVGDHDESNAKRSKDAHKKQSNAKPCEPPKDYIHVRARRGQATDSHSLAERVRREKISERMKFLQDLVPGCSKVTGKAVMLDEIINYVQSLQRQVEFLSMKLATFNTRLDLNLENYIPKEMNQVHAPMPPHSAYPLEATSTATCSYAQPQGNEELGGQYPVNHLDSGLRRMQLLSFDGFGDPSFQLGAFWEDDLHSVVQMGFGQNQEAALFHGLSPAPQMKIEL